MRLALRFSEARWRQVERAWSAWWAGELERPLVVLECVEPGGETTPHYAATFLGNYYRGAGPPFTPHSSPSPGSQGQPDVPAHELLGLFVPRLEATHYLGDAFPRFWPNFGPGIVAAFAGARLHAVSDTTWFSPGDDRPLPALRVACDPAGAWWHRVRQVTRAAVDCWGGQLAVGLTDLGGNLDIVASLRGTERLLLDLIDAPAEVDRLVAETTRAWLACYDELASIIAPAGRGITCWGPCWSPGRGYMLQSDFAYMISPRMFERFVLPDLAACCQALDYAFYHLDGRGQIPHLDHLLALPRLRGIQWVPGDGRPPPEQWLPLLARIRSAGKLCQVTVSPRGALTIVRELGGRGFCLNIEGGLSPADGEAFLEELARLSS